jgi:hypothetical protein
MVSRSRATPGNPQTLRVLTPEPSTRAVDVRRLSEGLTLVVLPKWSIAPDRRSPDWVSRADPYALQEILAGPLGAAKGVGLSRREGGSDVVLSDDRGQPIGAVRMVREQFLSGVRPIVTDQAGGILLGEFTAPGGNPVLVLSDPDLLSTYALRDLNGARTALAVLDAARPGPGPVVFDVTLNGYERGRNLWKLAFEPPFLAATLCVLAAALMMGLQAAVRFGAAGREERAIGLGKRALADNQAGLIRMAKREHRMAEPYARLVRDRTARIVGAGQVADERQLETVLDRLGRKRTELSIAELSSEARQVADPAGLMRLARRLHQWKLEISRERQ